LLPYDVPAGLLEQRALGPDWTSWLDRLPRLFQGIVEEWELTYDGPPRHGFCSLVAPVRTRAGSPAVLKVSFDGDTESEHEGVALQHWNGRGTVRLLRADPRRRALLLERLHPDDLTTLWDVEACELVAGFYARLHVPALPMLRPVTAYVERWVDALSRLAPGSAIPRRFVEQAVALARDLVAQGRLGEIRHVRAQYLQDWIVDPEFPLVWRLQKDKAGSGALGDIGAHIIDAAEFISGQLITGVSALTETFIKERPLSEGSSGLAAAGGSGRGTVTVDDAALFTARLSGGAVGSFEATRFATGRKNAMRIELNGSLGSLAFDFESMNELWFSEGGKGFERILVTEPDHPYVGAWWPPGHGLGYEHTFTHEIRDFLEAIGQGTDPTPSFADGLRVQRVLAAVEQSAADGSRFTTVEDT
jgi:predicted dehydrogenase